MSNDMPDDLKFPDEIYISNKLKTWTVDLYSAYEAKHARKYYSESHVQQLIKEAEQRQRLACLKAYYDAPWGEIESAILNAGGE